MPLDDIIQVRYSAEAGGRVTVANPDGPSETIDAKSLKDMPRLLRNSIAHFDIRPINVEGRFGGIRVWNRNKRKQITFVADLNFDAFRPLAQHILQSLQGRKELDLADPPDPLHELERQAKLSPGVKRAPRQGRREQKDAMVTDFPQGGSRRVPVLSHRNANHAPFRRGALDALSDISNMSVPPKMLTNLSGHVR